ncbi:hypothetical protein [Actinopolymorpha pittospori]|uniref:Uncharacterized protein n=1 Tax=Actinopolymorpha pittospori TaxID=648752 RepID=A0A927MT51_9ACTN|nr:hypothetical protein [Actinopolymorpha pittospori]MBE1605846.1 hypothetical protein [Actinopolymorpha pittospori]
MTPERVAKLVAWWARSYTQGLPTPIAERRISEIDADLHDHIAHARAHGTSDRRIALAILWRMVRGLTADAPWRRRVRPVEGSPMKPFLAVFTIAIGLAAIVLGGIDDAPGGQVLGLLLIIGVGSAWLFRWRAARKRPPADESPRDQQ